MTLQFDVFDSESGAFTDRDPAVHQVAEQLEQLYDDYESDQLGEKAYLAALGRLSAASPDSIRVHSHIADYWHHQGKPKKALEARCWY